MNTREASTPILALRLPLLLLLPRDELAENAGPGGGPKKPGLLEPCDDDDSPTVEEDLPGLLSLLLLLLMLPGTYNAAAAGILIFSMADSGLPPLGEMTGGAATACSLVLRM